MKWRDMKEKAGKFLPGMFGLRSYGDSLMTSAVRAWMIAFGVILLVQFGFDLFAWNRAWSYGLPRSQWYGLPLLLSFGIATAVLIFDRAIITADITTSRSAILSMLGRFVVLCVIALLTAVPVELAVFESEIDQAIDQKEKIALDALRVKAIDTETTKYDKAGGLLDEARAKYDGDGTPTKPGLIAEAKGRVDPGATQARTDAEAALHSYTAKRGADRRAKIGSLEADVVRLTAEVAAQQARLDQEITGKGGTGRRGVGTVTKMQVDQLRKLQGDLTTAQAALSTMQNSADLKAFDAETTTEIARLQAAIGGNSNKVKGEAQGRVDDLVKERDSAIATLRATRDTKIEGLRIMSGDDLANNYGGQWRQSRGFMDRFRELRGITESDSASAWIVWGCRLIMVIIGLIIMILKLLAKGDFGDYYNRDLQMAAAEPGSELDKVAIAKGYTDPRVRAALGFDFKTIALLDILLQVRTSYAEKYREWRTYLLSLCTPLPTGFCRTREEIRSLLETKWRTAVEDQGDKVVDAEQNLTETGIPVPLWPTPIGPNPATLNRPWDPTADELIANGWEDPGPIKDQIRVAHTSLRTLRGQFENVVLTELEKPLKLAIARAPRENYTRLRFNLEPARIDVFTATLAPLLQHMREVEAFLTERGERIAAWKPAFLHSVDELERIHLLPSPAMLRSHYGWRGQEDDQAMATALPIVRPAPIVLPPLPPAPAPVIPDPAPAPVDAPPVDAPAVVVPPPALVDERVLVDRVTDLRPPPAPVPDPATPVATPTPVEPVVIATPPATPSGSNGHDTAPDAIASTTAPLVPTVECWNCTMDLPVDYQFCGFCGSPHDRPVVPATAAPAPDAEPEPATEAPPPLPAPPAAAAPTP